MKSTGEKQSKSTFSHFKEIDIEVLKRYNIKTKRNTDLLFCGYILEVFF